MISRESVQWQSRRRNEQGRKRWRRGGVPQWRRKSWRWTWGSRVHFLSGADEGISLFPPLHWTWKQVLSALGSGLYQEPTCTNTGCSTPDLNNPDMTHLHFLSLLQNRKRKKKKKKMKMKENNKTSWLDSWQIDLSDTFYIENLTQSAAVLLAALALSLGVFIDAIDISNTKRLWKEIAHCLIYKLCPFCPIFWVILLPTWYPSFIPITKFYISLWEISACFSSKVKKKAKLLKC